MTQDKSPVPQFGTPGSEAGVASNGHPYADEQNKAGADRVRKREGNSKRGPMATALETLPGSESTACRDKDGWSNWVLAAAVFAHGMAELGDDGLAAHGDHDVDGERRVCERA